MNGFPLWGIYLYEARSSCNVALALSDDPSKVLGSLGLVGLKQEEFDKALADYDAAHQAKPEDASFLYGRGIAALRLGRKAEGNADIAAAMMLDRKISETFSSYGVLAQ